MIRSRSLSGWGLTLLLIIRFAVGAGAGESWERADIYSFGQRDPQGGRNPHNAPILGVDGLFYGTTPSGGAFGKGVVYRFEPNTSSYVVVRHFIGGSDGGMPIGSAFLQADDARLYGLAVNPRLILYSLATDGSDYRILFTFPPGAEQGGNIATVNSLTAGPDGLIYGVYMTGGSGGGTPMGTLFRIARDGTGYEEFITLANASSPLSFGAGGQMFGETFETVYRLNPDGSGFETIHTFPPPPFGTALAEGGLVHASDGFLYGQTDLGGTNNFGTFFRLRPDGSDFQVIFEPTVVTEAGHFRSPAFESSDGFLYGSVGEDGFGTQSFQWRIRKDGTGWQVLHRMLFNGRGTTGVLEAADGFLYSHTTGGPGGQELFKLARDGSSFAIVHTFPSSEGFPVTPVALVLGSDQRFYGLTDQDGTDGHGTLFQIEPDGSGFTILHDFGMGLAPEIGTNPRTLSVGPDGAIYGIVGQQGSAGAGIFRYTRASNEFTWLQTFASGATATTATIFVANDGMLYGAIDTAITRTERIFRLTTQGSNFVTLRTLTSTVSGFNSTAALTEGTADLLYGVTTRNTAGPTEVLFSLTKDGVTFIPLHEINVGVNPMLYPPRSLLSAQDGRLYGFTSNVLFRSTADGTDLQVLHTYGQVTFGRSLLETDGQIYGVLPFEGSTMRGSIFRLNPDGSAYEEVIVFPSDPLSGQAPLGFLVSVPNSALYGLTQIGGYSNRGTIFRAAPSTGATPTPSPSPTPSATSTPTPTATGTPGVTPSPTAGPTASATPSPSPTPTPSETVTPTPTPTSTPSFATLLNISTRLRVETGDQVLIGGFIVTGSEPLNAVIRGLGPSLGSQGISDFLPDPVLELRNDAGTLIASNDNWQDDPVQAASLVKLNLAPGGTLESALIRSFQPGAYTTVVGGKNGAAGVGLVEVYNVNNLVSGPSQGSELANISTRGGVQTGNDVMIGGFILGGDTTGEIALRGIGPSLAQSGITDFLADPTLELRDSNGALLFSNDDWHDDSASAAELTAHGLALSNSAESGIFVALSPGSFTVILAGKNGGSGISLVEIYAVR